jgi:hypothetical protein
VTTLNRFPLLGLWAEEAARRLGYRRDEAESLGQGYAVLYAIRAARRPKPAEGHAGEPKPTPKPTEHVLFGGDRLDVIHDAAGHLRARVGGERPQTPAGYRASVQAKFPPGYYDRLRDAFRRLLKTYPPKALRGRAVYTVYDQWKKQCGVGRSVDLDCLVQWCEENAASRMAGA